MTQNIFKSAALLALFALAGTSSLLWVHANTKDRIEENERLLLLSRLNEIVPTTAYDNDLAMDTYAAFAPEQLGANESLSVYRARLGDESVAAILTTVTPDGYSGPIRMLIGIYANGQLAGVRAIQHRETPGLGDKIETSRSDWILGFNGKSLNNPTQNKWAVKPDGGAFDTFTGATVTPRAMVKAIHNALVYFDENRDLLFDTPKEKSK